jgi:hypothetical protein
LGVKISRKSLQKSVRYLAVGALILLVLTVVAANTGMIPEGLLIPVLTVVVLGFFLSVAAYAGSFVIVAMQNVADLPTMTFYPVAEDVPNDLAQKYAEAERKVLAGGFAVWGGLICIFAFGYLGSLIRGDPGGIVGAGIGVLITLAALVFLALSWLSAVEARQQAWRRLGRHRWEFLGYLAATVALAVLVAVGNHVIRTTQGHGAVMAFFILVVVRLRLIWKGLW